MRALRHEGPGRLVVVDCPDPEPEPGGAIVRVLACGICGTDLRIARGGHRAYGPDTRRIPGHEIVAEIVEAEARVGERVFIAPNIGCGRCEGCRAGRVNLCEEGQAFGITLDGGLAQLMAVPPRAVAQGNLLTLPAEVDPAVGSLIEPLACVLRGERAARVGAGDRVLICGAGPIGLLHAMVAGARGAEVMVSEPGTRRREQAARFGAARTVDPTRADLRDEVMDWTQGRGADAVIVAVPVPAVQEQALSLAAIGGAINLFGGLPRGDSIVGLDTNLIHYRELVVTGTTANDVEDCREALELVGNGAVALDRLVSARFGLDAAPAAFTAAGSGEELKVVVEP